MNDKYVNNWFDLIEVLHSKDIIPHQPQQGGHFRSSYVFRGMSNSSWHLETSLERLGTPPQNIESALLRSFRKYAPRGTFSQDSDWEEVSVAQHNGLPTRVLDWCISPLIAAHFATCERDYFSKDGVIWCVDVIALRNYILPPLIASNITSAGAVVFDVAILKANYPSFSDFDSKTSSVGDVCVFFEPPSIDSRIANQTGILSAMNGATKSHHYYFQQLANNIPNIVRRIIIKASAKSEIRDMLDQNSINERLLFPGLPGLCDWLRRYYGPV